MKRYMSYLLALALPLALANCAKVGPQEGGVRTSMIGFSGGFGESEWFKQGIKSRSLQPGLYLHIPHVSEVSIYPVNELQYQMTKSDPENRDDVSFKTKDGQIAWIEVSVLYRLMFEKLPVMHRQYGDKYLENVLRPTIRSLINNKFGEYSAENIYDGSIRQKVAAEVRDLINEGVEEHPGTMDAGLQVVDVLLRRFEFTEGYQNAIEQKRIATEQKLAAVELAKKREAEATGEKLAEIQKAEGEAQRVKLEAEAQLYSKLKEAEGVEAVGIAQAKVQAALTEALGGGDQVVRLEFAKRLAESLQVWGIPTGSASNSFMDLSGIFGPMFNQSQPSKPLREAPIANN